MGPRGAASPPIPAHLDWLVWRIVSSDRFSVQPWEIKQRWTIDEVLDAHDVLDLYHDADVLQANHRYLESKHRSWAK